MEIKAAQLSTHLRQQLLPVYLVTGDEPQQLIDVCQSLRAKARQQGYDERLLFTLESRPPWQDIIDAVATAPMFASGRIIEFRFERQPDKSDCEHLLQLTGLPARQTLFIIQCPRLKANTAAQRLLAGSGKETAVIKIWPLNDSQTRNWLRNRLTSRKLQLSDEGLDILFRRVSGNLIAAASEVEKLTLFADAKGRCDSSTVLNAVADNCRYDVFQLADHALRGDGRGCVRIIDNLRTEGIEPLIPLAVLNRELRNLVPVARDAADGIDIDTALSRRRAWPRRIPLMRSAVLRHGLKGLQQLAAEGIQVDLCVRGQLVGSAWQRLELLVLGLAGLSFR